MKTTKTLAWAIVVEGKIVSNEWGHFLTYKTKKEADFASGIEEKVVRVEIIKEVK